MAPYIVCNKCGRKGLKEYRMELMHGPNGFRRYSVCENCATGKGEKRGGGRQRRKRLAGSDQRSAGGG